MSTKMLDVNGVVNAISGLGYNLPEVEKYYSSEGNVEINGNYGFRRKILVLFFRVKGSSRELTYKTRGDQSG
jgi:hypothetical protein